MIMAGAELEALRPHAIVGASLSFCHLLGPHTFVGAEFLPELSYIIADIVVGGTGCASGGQPLATMESKCGCFKRVALG